MLKWAPELDCLPDLGRDIGAFAGGAVEGWGGGIRDTRDTPYLLMPCLGMGFIYGPVVGLILSRCSIICSRVSIP